PSPDRWASTPVWPAPWSRARAGSCSSRPASHSRAATWISGQAPRIRAPRRRRAIPRSTRPRNRAMNPVVVDQEIERPAEVVWEYMENAEHNPEWQSNMRSAHWTTEPPIAVGSRYEQLARFLGKDVRTSFEVTALEPGRSITISSLPGSSFPIRITREVEPL